MDLCRTDNEKNEENDLLINDTELWLRIVHVYKHWKFRLYCKYVDSAVPWNTTEPIYDNNMLFVCILSLFYCRMTCPIYNEILATETIEKVVRIKHSYTKKFISSAQYWPDKFLKCTVVNRPSEDHINGSHFEY